jgi:hypothetical protein
VLKTSKKHQWSKPPHLLELRDEYTPGVKTHLVASYDHAGINSGCNSYASVIKGNPSATRSQHRYVKYIVTVTLNLMYSMFL